MRGAIGMMMTRKNPAEDINGIKIYELQTKADEIRLEMSVLQQLSETKNKRQ